MIEVMIEVMIMNEILTGERYEYRVFGIGEIYIII
jgi:hypothetical protein